MSDNLERCRGCLHYRPTTIFELCTHPSSAYTALGKRDHHTIGHVRSTGACRNEGLLYSPVPL